MIESIFGGKLCPVKDHPRFGASRIRSFEKINPRRNAMPCIARIPEPVYELDPDV